MEQIKGKKQMKEPTKAELKAKIAKLEKEVGDFDAHLKYAYDNLMESDNGEAMVCKHPHGIQICLLRNNILLFMDGAGYWINLGSDGSVPYLRYIEYKKRVDKGETLPLEQQVEFEDIQQQILFVFMQQIGSYYDYDHIRKMEILRNDSFKVANNPWVLYMQEQLDKLQKAKELDPKADKEALDALRTAEVIKDMPAPTEEEIKALTTKQK